MGRKGGWPRACCWGVPDVSISTLVNLCGLRCRAGPRLLPYRYDLVIAPYQLAALPTAEERRRLVMQLWERWDATRGTEWVRTRMAESYHPWRNWGHSSAHAHCHLRGGLYSVMAVRQREGRHDVHPIAAAYRPPPHHTGLAPTRPALPASRTHAPLPSGA